MLESSQMICQNPLNSVDFFYMILSMNGLSMNNLSYNVVNLVSFVKYIAFYFYPWEVDSVENDGETTPKISDVMQQKYLYDVGKWTKYFSRSFSIVCL
jgi:hypothetical protein